MKKKTLILSTLVMVLALSSCSSSQGGLPGAQPHSSAPTNVTSPSEPAVEQPTEVPTIQPPATETPGTVTPATEAPATQATETTQPTTSPQGAASVFKAVLTEYEPYFEPDDRDAYVQLINISHPLASDYAPSDLVDITDTRKDGRAAQRMRSVAEKALQGFLIEARANGYTDVSITSGYRDYNTQQYLLTQQINSLRPQYGDKAETEALKWVTMPGASEHQSGLCADMHNLSAADVKFAQTDAAKWMMANCQNFGFILRYPEDKTDITGISFEPWHYRYVGRYHAKKMVELGMCLEEYTDYLTSH